jgi:aromatic ring-opening dioxygenase catalytic subunit (LigB family)
MNTIEKAQPTDITTRMPTWFIPHGGGPCFFMDWNPPRAWDKMAAFLKGVAATLPRRPEAILVVSAHWLESGFHVTSAPRPELIYDYYGFPPHTYALKYPASGEPRLASRIAELLGQANLASHADPSRGFDHGMFIPLMLMFPEADIPVVQVSLRRDLDPARHLQAGQALAPLRDEGVLILGSGMSFHNMRGLWRSPLRSHLRPVRRLADGRRGGGDVTTPAIADRLGSSALGASVSSPPGGGALAAAAGGCRRGHRSAWPARLQRPGDGNHTVRFPFWLSGCKRPRFLAAAPMEW